MLKRFVMGAAVGASLAALGGTAHAADCGVDCDTTLRQGRVFEAGDSVVAYGSGDLKLVRTWVPLLIDDGTALMNNSVVRIVDGRILGGTTTFSAIPYVVISFGTADLYDANGTYTSNDIVVWESSGYSNTVGQLLGNGGLVWRANYAGAAQNNLEWTRCVPGQQTPIPEPTGGTGVLQGPGIDNADDDAYLGTPAAIEHGTNFYVGVTGFGPSGNTIPTGCNIYDYDPEGPALFVQDPAYTYTQAAGEAFAIAHGVPITTYGSQTQPVFAKVNDVYYVVFGINESTQGGSARPALLAVDAFEDDDGFTGAVAVMAPAGFRFVDHKATGGGSNVYENAHFDMNSSGQLVALTEREVTGDPNDAPTYQALRYDPLFTGERITGFSEPTIIADAGPLDSKPEDGLVGPFYIGDPPNIEWINAISGVGINEAGNVAFVGLYDTGEPIDPNDPNSPTRWDDAAYFYDASADTLHQVLRENDVLVYDNNGSPIQLALGPIAREDSDAFMAAGLADDADVLAVNFRSNRDSLDGLSRGVAVVAVGHDGDVDFDGDVDLSDLAALLSGYGSAFETPAYDSQADFDLDGDIDLNDLAVLLANYGS
ncbi:MAG: hypothetical protein ACE5I3_11700 [Phycisphaerae bacterium]